MSEKFNNRSYIFFDRDGNLLADRDEFVDIYSKEYFCQNRDIDCEKEVEKILGSSEPLTPDDVEAILLWKTGGRYDSKIGVITGLRSPDINVQDVWKKVADVKRGLCSEPSFKKREDYFCLLKDLELQSGIGKVYALTFIYFLPQGVYPLYDRFADIAAYAIYNSDCGPKSIPYGGKIRYHDVSNRRYKRYYQNIKAIFEDQYKERNVDRALWAYGHQFNTSSKGTDVIEMTYEKLGFE